MKQRMKDGHEDNKEKTIITTAGMGRECIVVIAGFDVFFFKTGADDGMKYHHPSISKKLQLSEIKIFCPDLSHL